MERKELLLLKDLLEIPSVNSKDKEQNVAKYLANYFYRHGISAHVQSIDDTHANVIAFVPGKDSSRTMIWNGHLDTVPYGNLSEWESDPSCTTVKGGKIYGRGASDMKSGLAAMVYALCHSEEPPAYNIQFLGTCDEEKNGLGARKILEENLLSDGEFLLIGEPTGMHLGIMQKGCLWLEINIKGRTSHGAYPQEGVSAIHQGIRLAEGIKAYVETFESPLLGNSTAQITMVEGGVAINMTADTCCIRMDIRMVPGLTKEMVLDWASAFLKEEQKISPELNVEFVNLNDRRAISISPDHPLVQAMRGHILEKGYEGSDLGINFFTDASVLDSEDRKKILLFGPGEPYMAHKANEYVEIKKYIDAIQILRKFMQDCIL